MPKKGNDPAFRDKFQQIVGSEVDKINYIVKQLLEFSKPAKLQPEETNINKLLDETLDLLNNDLTTHNIKVKKYFSSSANIKIDPTQIKQVFLNLFLNAIDAMPNGGTLAISMKAVSDKLQIQIKDTGRGMDKYNLKHIFDPFFSKKDGGTGLGLSIVHGIIEKHGGKITVNSAINKGTEFIITLKD